MTTTADIVNRALQAFGKRTTVTTTELANQTTNEAKQAAIAIDDARRELLRMAPWNCGLKFARLTLITAASGTPENTSQATEWAPGLPPPPWVYEYQYPVDCLRPCWIVSINPTSTIDGVPIFPVITGWSPATFTGPAIRYKVATDKFRPVTAAAVQAGGTGHAVGDVITLATTPAGSAPIGAPVQLLVTAAPAGVITTVTVVSQVLGTSPNQGGSYFAPQTNPVAQSATTGAGVGATFNLTYGATATQRVILTNQQDAILAYIQDQQDIDVMDPLFQDAWINILASKMCFTLTGDKALSNSRIQLANNSIEEARKSDGNEGLTVDDRIPEWIRVRGYSRLEAYNGPGFDWGGLWPEYR